MEGNHFVSIRNLHFSRNGRKVFDGVDMDIRRGKITAVMGPSGSGKTTLLRLIGGQLIPDQGTVDVDGDIIHHLSRKKLYEIRKKMGLLFQTGALFTNINVFDNVAFPLREHTPLSESMIRDLVLLKLEAVGLRGARDLMPNELSGGMARRVALARSIALDPDLMMYDEPFTGQDPISMGVLVKLIKTLSDAISDMTSIIVSHDVAETMGIADYVYVISDGKVVGQGTPEELGHKKSDYVEQFIDGNPDGPVPFHYPAKDLKMDLLLSS
jgi:phospholipid/cholesterol/gamma-HCH transport system ATP-binding protein